MQPRWLNPHEWKDCLEWGSASVRKPFDLKYVKQEDLPLLHVYCLPSFDDARGWTVYQTRQQEQEVFRVHTVLWRQGHDQDRMIAFHNQPRTGMARYRPQPVPKEPTVETSLTSLDAAWWREQYGALDSIRIACATQGPIGCDGAFFGLARPDLFHHYAFEWWEEGPPEWCELVAWANECMAFFKQLIPDANQTA